MNKCELLEAFAEIATTAYDDGHQYRDISDPNNMRSALEFYNKHLGFLGNRERQELLIVWEHACDDPRDTKVFLEAVSILKEEYRQEVS